MRDIGKNIRDLRRLKQMTQDELAEKLFVTRQTVSNYEVGKSRPDVEMLVKIGEVLGVDIHELLYGPAPKPDKKRMYLRLGIGLGVTVLFAVLYIWLKPIGVELRTQRYLTGLYSTVGTLILPLFWLCCGWTTCQGIAAVLGKPYVPPKWAGYLKWVLLGLLLAYFVPVGWFDGVILGDTLKALNEASYTSVVEVPEWVSFMVLKVFFSAGSNFSLSGNMGLFSLFGIALWLCGFPKNK